MNKQTIILALSLLLTAGQSLAQKLELEFMIRPALTSVRGNGFDTEILEPKLNFSAGLEINYFVRSNSLMNLGIMYDKKGGNGKSTLVFRDSQGLLLRETEIEIESNFDYVTIPIQWSQRFGGKVKYQFGFGIYTSLLLKQETVIKYLDTQETSSQKNTDAFRTLDFGLSTSFIVFFPINEKLKIKTVLDNNIGLTSVSEAEPNGTMRHNSLGLALGLNYRVD